MWIFDIILLQAMSFVSILFTGSWIYTYHTITTTMAPVFSPGTPVFSTNKICRHDIIEILLKVALYTINTNSSLYIVKRDNVLRKALLRFLLIIWLSNLSSVLYLWLFAHSSLHHILCYVFVLCFFVLCIICCQFL